MRFEVGHAATSLTPDRHDDPTSLDGTPDDAVGPMFLGVAQAIATLRLPMLLGVPEFLRVGALVFPAAVAAPGLPTIGTEPAASELADVLLDAAFRAELNRPGFTGEFVVQ